jgi:hypothetical protein
MEQYKDYIHDPTRRTYGANSNVNFYPFQTRKTTRRQRGTIHACSYHSHSHSGIATMTAMGNRRVVAVDAPFDDGKL